MGVAQFKSHQSIKPVAYWGATFGLLAGCGLAASPASAATLLIDDFITQQVVEVTAAAPPIQSAGNSANTITAIGGERDLYVEKTAGSNGERVRSRTNPEDLDLLRMTIDDANGRVVVTWDGADGNPNPGNVNYNGLGKIDFTPFPLLEILVTFSDIGGPVRFTFWDGDDLTGNTFATTTFNLPGGIPAGSQVPLTQAFANFTPTGGTLTDIFSSVGAIQMEIDARAVAQQGWDMRIDSVRAVPEPVTILGAATAAGFGAFFKRELANRKKKGKDSE